MCPKSHMLHHHHPTMEVFQITRVSIHYTLEATLMATLSVEVSQFMGQINTISVKPPSVHRGRVANHRRYQLYWPNKNKSHVISIKNIISPLWTCPKSHSLKKNPLYNVGYINRLRCISLLWTCPKWSNLT